MGGQLVRAQLVYVDRGVQRKISARQLLGRRDARLKTVARANNAALRIPNQSRGSSARPPNANRFVRLEISRGERNARGKTAVGVAIALVATPNLSSPNLSSPNLWSPNLTPPKADQIPPSNTLSASP